MVKQAATEKKEVMSATASEPFTVSSSSSVRSSRPWPWQGLHPYDICAPIAVIEAAGGVVTDWTGGPVHDGGRALAAANPILHAKALALLTPFAD